MEEVIKIFEQIKNTNSLNEKTATVMKNKDNELFKECLVFLLDSNITTGLSNKKLNKKVNITKHINITCSFRDIMKYLKINNSGRDSDISIVQGFINKQPEKYRDFYSQMVTKTYKLGADKKLINKCIPNLIPAFNVMLGISIEHCKINDSIWFSLSQKINGNRCVYYNGEFYTRQGKKYSGLKHIKQDIEKITNAEDYVFDGELVYKNPEGLSDSEAFQKGTGIAQSKNETKEELRLILFDVLPKEEFDKGISTDTYKSRREKLIALKNFETENFQIVDMFYEGTNQSEIWKWLDYAEQHDMEGLMLSLDAPYECKRTKNLIKIKKFYEYDLRIIGAEEGTGRNKGKLGAFVVDYKGNRVNVGAGFTDEERKKFWNNKEYYIGRVIEVKYKEITKDKKTGLESLQFPVFCSLREEGKEVSYN